VREQRSGIDAAGLAVACVVQGTADDVRRFCGRHGIEALCVPDPDKASYRAMGLERTSWGALLRPSSDLKRRRGEARASGCGVSLSGTFRRHSDVLQLPGAALVARGGEILWLHRGTHPGDLPPIARLLEVARERLRAPGGAAGASAVTTT
jgi:hypothetical protein